VRSGTSIARLALLVAMAACGGGASSGPAASDGRARPGAPATTSADAVARPLDREDCTRLLDRYLELEQAELRASLPPEEVPTEEQVAAIRTRMHADGMPGCVGQPRAPYACAMAAPTKPALRACLEPSPGAR
jgi:hypothetical protein